MAQALKQADTDVAIEAWADRSAAPRDLAQLMAEVSCLFSAHSSSCTCTLGSTPVNSSAFRHSALEHKESGKFRVKK